VRSQVGRTQVQRPADAIFLTPNTEFGGEAPSRSGSSAATHCSPAPQARRYLR
jgi:hypothetical protein